MTQAILTLSPLRAFSASIAMLVAHLRRALSTADVPCWTEYLRETRSKRG